MFFRHLTRTAATLSCIALTVLTTGCGNNKPIRLQGEAQGSYYTISYYDKQQRNLQSSIDSLLRLFDTTASLWVDNSMIRQVNEGKDSIVNRWFADMLQYSVDMHNYTNGCFDCTIGPLVNAWGFGFSKQQELSEQLIDSLKMHIGKQPYIIYDSTRGYIIRKPDPNIAIDFNAIAQGYSTDLVSHFLESKGISNYIVDIGGEVYAKGEKPDGTPWRVGIERPAENQYSAPEIETTIDVRNKAIVTSGSYRKYYEKDGIRYSHTIDPTTGRPVTHSLLSVTVVDTAAWRADALATAFMVMGLDRAKEFIDAHTNDRGTQAVFFIYSEGGEYRHYSTPGFKSLINNH